MSTETLSLLTRSELHAGLVVGLLGLIAGVVVKTIWRSRDAPLPGIGLFLAIGALAVMPVTRSVPASVWAATGLLAVAGTISAWRGLRLPWAVLAAFPGAWLLAFSMPVPRAGTWIPWTVLGAIALGAPLVYDFDRRHRNRGFGPPLVGLSVLGILFTVPETGEALVLTGTVLPLALLGWPILLACLSGPGAFAATGVLVWVSMVGGYGRPASVIGALACLGLLVAEPVGRLIARSATPLDRMGPGLSSSLLVGFLQLIVVFVASRVAGLRESAMWAAVIAVGLLSGSVAVIALLSLRKSG